MLKKVYGFIVVILLCVVGNVQIADVCTKVTAQGAEKDVLKVVVLDENCQDQQGIVYQLQENGTAIAFDTTIAFDTICEEQEGIISIPQFVEYDNKCYEVTDLGNDLFANKKNIVKVTLSDSVMHVSGNVFHDSSLKVLSIGMGVKEITGDAFWSCKDLERIEISEENKWYYVEDDIVYGQQGKELVLCTWKNHLDVKTFKVPDGVTILGRAALINAPCSYVELNDVQTVGDMAFYGSAIKGIDLTGIKSIGQWAFLDCNELEWVRLAKSCKVRSIFVNCPALKCVYFPGDFTYDSNDAGFSESTLLMRCDNIKCAVLEEGNKKISREQFTGKVQIETVILPESLESIESKAFAGCKDLKRIYIPASVNLIGSDCFMDCDITIYGEKHSEAEYYAQEHGISFVDMKMHQHANYIMKTIYNDAYHQIKGVYCEECGKAENVSIFQWDDEAPDCGIDYKEEQTKRIVLLDENCQDSQGICYGLQEGELASIVDFKGGPIRHLVIPEQVSFAGEVYSVDSISMEAFQKNESIRVVTVPDTIRYIAANAFENSFVEYIYLGAGLENTDPHGGIFSGCNSLKCITVSEDNNDLKSVDGILYSKNDEVIIKYPAKNNTQEEQVFQLSDTVHTIAAYAFENTKIPFVRTSKQLRIVEREAFAHSAIWGMDLSNVQKLGYGAFSFCNQLHWVVLGDELKCYDQWDELKDVSMTFYMCDQIESLYIPKACCRDDSMFGSVDGMEFLAFEDGIECIGASEFINGKLKSVTLPEGMTEIRQDLLALNPGLKKIYIPVTVTRIEENAFYNNESATKTLYGFAGGVVEQFAAEIGAKFVDVSSHDHKNLTVGEIYRNSYLSYEGVRCTDCCYQRVDRVKILDTAYEIPNVESSGGQPSVKPEDGESTEQDVSTESRTDDSEEPDTSEQIVMTENSSGNPGHKEEEKTTEVSTEVPSEIQVPDKPMNEKPVIKKIKVEKLSVVKIMWDAVSGVDVYEVQRAKSGKDNFETIATVKQLSYEDNKVKVNETYCYRVRGVATRNGIDIRSPYSEEQSILVTNLKTPRMKVTKKKTLSGTKYVEINLTAYGGKYAEIYIRQGKGKYKKVALKNNELYKDKHIFRIGYLAKKKYMYVKLRTYNKSKKKKIYSPFSKEKKIKIK